jgi:hypothetical protein
MENAVWWIIGWMLSVAALAGIVAIYFGCQLWFYKSRAKRMAREADAENARKRERAADEILRLRTSGGCALAKIGFEEDIGCEF